MEIRQAVIDDLPAVVRMLAHDFLGEQRERLEDPLPENYLRAFE
jgi:GNAT superfamily N-acetyltransferase